MGWAEVSGDYIVGPNKTYKVVSIFKRTKGSSLDSTIEAGLNQCMSNAEIEDKIFKETGDRVKVINRYTQTEVPGKEYSYTIVFDSQDTHSFVLLAVCIIVVVGIVASWFLLDKLEHSTDKFFEQGLSPAINTAVYVLAGVVIIILINALKR